MTGAELKAFYEKLYFLELEARDKINARLQLSLTLLLALTGAVVFLLQNFDSQSASWTATRVTFVFFFAVGAVILVVATGSFVGAFWNHEYYFLPASQKTAEYKLLLEETYRSYQGQQQLVADALDKYLTDYYVQYASFNTQVNDRRSAYLHICNGATIASALLFVAAYLVFYFGELDKSRIKPVTEVVIPKPVDVRIQDARK